MAVLTHLFKHSDRNRNMKLEADEKTQFLAGLEQLLRKLPGFDMAIIRDAVGEGDVKRQHIKEIVDVVVKFGVDTPAEAGTVKDE